MMQKPNARSGMGLLGIFGGGSKEPASASRETPRGSGFALSVKRVNDPYRTRTMAVPVATATSQPRYLAAQGAA